jgi:hypothetical protein
MSLFIFGNVPLMLEVIELENGYVALVLEVIGLNRSSSSDKDI